MEWHQLEYFHAVAKLQHFTRAAEKLSISQPALSRSIARLEEELGVPLFERRGKNIILNRYGQIFLKHVDRAMQEISNARQEIQNLIDPDRGLVSLAFLHSLGTHLVPDLIGRFHAKYPGIKFKLYQNATNLLLDQLESGEIDLCLSQTIVTREGIEWAELFTEELFVIVPSEHRLSGRNSVRITEIADEPIITFKRDYGLRILTDQLFLEAGISPHITFEGEEIMTVAGLVEAKLGIAIIPHTTGFDIARLSFIPISEPICHRTIGLAWVNERYTSPAARVFRDFVLSSYR